MGVSGTFMRMLSAGIFCTLMLPQMALAEGTGQFYGKFRPLTGATETPSASKQGGRYSGETGYYLPRSISGVPGFAQPGYPYRGKAGAGKGRYSMSPRRDQQPELRFRPDHRQRNPTVHEQPPPYGAQPGPGFSINQTAPPGWTDPGYRFRPYGHRPRGY